MHFLEQQETYYHTHVTAVVVLLTTGQARRCDPFRCPTSQKKTVLRYKRRFLGSKMMGNSHHLARNLFARAREKQSEPGPSALLKSRSSSEGLPLDQATKQHIAAPVDGATRSRTL